MNLFSFSDASPFFSYRPDRFPRRTMVSSGGCCTSLQMVVLSSAREILESVVRECVSRVAELTTLMVMRWTSFSNSRGQLSEWLSGYTNTTSPSKIPTVSRSF
jgi:hypothetical protein